MGIKLPGLDKFETQLDGYDGNLPKVPGNAPAEGGEEFTEELKLSRTVRSSIGLLDRSVFSRLLEYYPRILLLSTNRVGAINDTYRSPIHRGLFTGRN
jgi:hypothetical protein